MISKRNNTKQSSNACDAISDPRDQIITHLSALRAFAFTLTHNHAIADDLVQDTIVKAWSRIEQFTPGTNMAAWLFTILRNCFYSDCRKSIRDVPDPDGIFAQQLITKPDHDGHLQLRDFYRALATLPDPQRETLVLLGAAGYTYAEAAQICGVSEGTIKSRASRGRKRLADLLDLDDSGAVPLTDQITQSIAAAPIVART